MSMKMKFLTRIAQLLALSVLVAGPALAQPDLSVRGYYRVTGLVAGDTLNVRRGPSTGAAIIGVLEDDTLAFATGRSAAPSGATWYEVSFEEQLGWVSAAYLDRMRVRTFAGTRAPVAGTCGGFEPGWDAQWNSAGIRASFFGESLGTAHFASAAATAGFSSPTVVIFEDGGPSRFTLVLRDEICTLLPVDSDSYQTGLLIVERSGRLDVYAGCCDAAPAAIGR